MDEMMPKEKTARRRAAGDDQIQLLKEK